MFAPRHYWRSAWLEGSSGRPGPVVESANVITQDLKIHIPHKNIFLEDRIVLARLLEIFRRKRRKNNIARLHLCTDAGELTELLRTQVGLDRALERLDQFRDFGDGIGTGKLIAQGTQDAVLVFGAGKASFNSNAGEGQSPVSIQMMRAGRENQTLVGIRSSASIDPLGQGNIDPADGIDDLLKCPHIDGGIMIDLGLKVECQGPC